MRVLRCYLYDNNKSRLLFKYLIKYINENKLEDITIEKGYERGLHIEITYPEERNYEGMERYIETFLDKHKQIYNDLDYAKFEKYIRTISSLEEANCEIIPLYKDGELVIEPQGTFQKKKELNSFRVTLEIERLKTKFLCSVYEKWNTLTEEEKNIELTKMFFITSNMNPEGIRVGYLSLRSNYEYFKHQLLDVKDKYKVDKWTNFIQYRSEKEQQFIKEGVNEFLKGAFDSELIFSKLNQFIYEIKDIFSKSFESGELYIKNMYMADDFFERHDSASDFHNTFYSNKNFVKQYHNKGFIVYRYIISTLYALMTLLNISPLERQKVTGMVAESVESKYNITWQDVYNEMNLKYGGEAINE